MKDDAQKVDAYIAKAAPFAQPILKKLRALFHKACPQIEETIKWGVPHFDYKGVVAGMAAFKNHASFGFWKGKLLSDPLKLFQGVGNGAMGGLRLHSVKDLPSDQDLLEYIREAVRLNDEGIKAPRPKRAAKKPATVPPDLRAALKTNKKALATFEAFSPSHKREYVEWITEAKQDATRAKRLATTIEWLAEGKPRNWKYMNC